MGWGGWGKKQLKRTLKFRGDPWPIFSAHEPCCIKFRGDPWPIFSVHEPCYIKFRGDPWPIFSVHEPCCIKFRGDPWPIFSVHEPCCIKVRCKHFYPTPKKQTLLKLSQLRTQATHSLTPSVHTQPQGTPEGPTVAEGGRQGTVYWHEHPPRASAERQANFTM